MSKISISRKHSLPPEVIKARLVELGTKLQDKYKAESSWSGDKTMNVKGPGVEGTLTIDSNKVDVNLELAWALKLMKGKIEEALTQELEKVTRPEGT